GRPRCGGRRGRRYRVRGSRWRRRRRWLDGRRCVRDGWIATVCERDAVALAGRKRDRGGHIGRRAEPTAIRLRLDHHVRAADLQPAEGRHAAARRDGATVRLATADEVEGPGGRRRVAGVVDNDLRDDDLAGFAVQELHDRRLIDIPVVHHLDGRAAGDRRD